MKDDTIQKDSINAQRIAELAHLRLNAERLTEVNAGLRAILDFGSQLQDIDTQEVVPTSQVTGLTDVVREDIVQPSSVSPEELLSAAPSREGMYFKVKRVMK